MTWYPPDTTPEVSTATPRKHRHRWDRPAWLDEQDRIGARCERPGCGAIRDPAISRRGRTARRAGGDGERLVEKLTGLTKVGEYGSSVDVGDASSWAIGQVKTGGRYSVQDERDLDAMAAEAHGRTRLLFKVNRPGTGRKRRVNVTLRLSDLMAEHGDCLVTLDMPDFRGLHVGGEP